MPSIPRPDVPRCVRLCAWALVAGFACLGGNAESAPVADPANVLQGFDHLAWPIERGAPGDIWDIAQAADGALWLATGSGLYRFDGRRFERQIAPEGQSFTSRNMTTLEITPDGAFWIGTYNAGVMRLADGRIQAFGEAQGIPSGLIPRITADADGRVWVAVDGGLRWFDGTRFQPPPTSMHYPGDNAHWLLRDSRGTLWVSTGTTIVHLPAHGTRFEPTGQAVTAFATLAERADGEIWLADRMHGLSPLADAHGVIDHATRDVRRLPGLKASRLRAASDGSLWASRSGGGGVLRVHAAPGSDTPRVERFDVAQGLTSTYAAPVLEDREGNLWVGTNQGLDRLRSDLIRALPMIGTPVMARHTLFQAVDGDVYAYGEDNRPWRLDRTLLAGIEAGRSRAEPPRGDVVWTTVEGKVQWQRDGEVHETPLPDVPERTYVHAMAFAGSAEAWMCLGRRYTLHHDGSGWREDPRLPALGCSVLSLHDDVLALGYPDGDVRVVQRDGVRHYTTADGLQVGPLTGLFAHEGRWLAAGENGLAILGADDRFHAVPSALDGMLEGINGLVVDGDAQLWLFGNRGLVRVAFDDVRRSVDTGNALSGARVFDAVDGLPGLALQASTVPTLALGRDGVLWMSTNHGLAWLDTHALRRNPVAPFVTIGAIAHGQLQQTLRDGLVLPEGTTQLQIDYAATSLSRPDRVNYRTRLVGVDTDWHDAGDLTRASYANLGPGRYRFEVQAANEDGLWSAHPAVREFRIAPTFVQTAAFKVLCAVLAVIVLAFAARLRGRQVAARVRTRLEERHEERERIARELHDTLLQGTQGLILRLHAASQRLPQDDPLRAELGRAMDLAEQAVTEGRERVQGLRQTALGTRELGAALLLVRDEVHGSAPAIALVLEGEPRTLMPCAAEELYLIGREALLNAIRHARAEAIEIEVGYGHRVLRLRVRDDGIGLPEGDAGRPGHFGISGMRERAERLGAEFQLWSRPSAGTEVHVNVAADRAYLHVRRGWLRRSIRLTDPP